MSTFEIFAIINYLVSYKVNKTYKVIFRPNFRKCLNKNIIRENEKTDM